MASEFSRTLSLLRQERGVSQRTAAGDLGISQALLSHYENGIREPGLAFVVKACEYYHVSADFILGRTLARDGSMLTHEEILDAAEMRKLDPYVDGWILYSHGYFRRPDHLAYVADALARGKTVWHYTCGESGRAPIYETYRLHPWFGARHGLTGNQFYIFQTMTGGYGPADFKTAASAGIAYRSFESTMPSLRYMSMRRGVEDLKYLDLLERVAGDRPEVKAFLAEAPVRVVETERHDRTAPDRMREKAAELILTYGKTQK